MYPIILKIDYHLFMESLHRYETSPPPSQIYLRDTHHTSNFTGMDSYLTVQKYTINIWMDAYYYTFTIEYISVKVFIL